MNNIEIARQTLMFLIGICYDVHENFYRLSNSYICWNARSVYLHYTEGYGSFAWVFQRLNKYH